MFISFSIKRKVIETQSDYFVFSVLGSDLYCDDFSSWSDDQFDITSDMSFAND